MNGTNVSIPMRKCGVCSLSFAGTGAVSWCSRIDCPTKPSNDSSNLDHEQERRLPDNKEQARRLRDNKVSAMLDAYGISEDDLVGWLKDKLADPAQSPPRE